MTATTDHRVDSPDSQRVLASIDHVRLLLAMPPGEGCQTEDFLRDHLHTDAGTLTRLLNELQREQVIDQRPDVKPARVWFLTCRGQALRIRAIREMREQVSRAREARDE